MATDIGSDELNDTAGGEHNRLKTLGKYRIERRIGAGGMGTVFLAVDDSLNRTVALKVLPKDRAENPVLVRRFKAEGQAAAHLEHPNIVRVFEAGEADGFLYMALEYIEGIDVHELVERRGVVPVKRSTDIIRQTTLALQHAHEKGIVHRDIKPSNLLIKRDGSVKLADLGLARSIDETLETNITRAGTTVGTVDYMSPEQARNSKAADVRSDIYSLGCTWYHMLTGHPPFPEGSMTNKLQAHAVSSRPDPRAENDRVPEGIVAIIQRMMASNPDDRYQGPQDLLDDLGRASKLHRSVDESVLAGLAEEAADLDEPVEPHAPDLRLLGEIDVADLAALKESGEHDVEQRPPVQPPAKSNRKKHRDRSARRDKSAKTASPVETREEQPARSKQQENRQSEQSESASSPRSPGQTVESVEAERETSSSRQSPSRMPAGKPTEETSPPRSTKRGTVTTTGGGAPALPGKMTSHPVQSDFKEGINLESLRYIIPAVLVVVILGAIVFAIIKSGDGLDGPAGPNPYADESAEQTGDVPKVAESTQNKQLPSTDLIDHPTAEEPSAADQLPFPGAEQAPQLAGSTRLVPDWVSAFRSPRKTAERTVIVRRRPVGNNDVASLNEALQKLSRSGGIIELAGEGPFRLSPAHIENQGRVRIQAADGHQPVIHLTPNAERSSSPILQLTRTTLELQGVHFVFAGEAAEGTAVFGVRDGNVNVRNCSLTVDRSQSGQMTGFQVEESATQRRDVGSGKCLFENVIIRGAGVTSIALIGPTADLVAGNCLFVSGDAPALSIVGRGRGKSNNSKENDEPAGVRLLATTVISTGSAIELAGHDGKSSIADCHIISRMSVLATSSSAPMADIHDWPMTESELGSSRPAGLSWSTDQCAFVGWNRLLNWHRSQGEPPVEVPAETDAWRTFWNQPLRTGTVIADALANVNAVEISPEQVQDQLAIMIPTESAKQSLGCRPAEFSVLPFGLIEHVVAAAHQPFDPDWLGEGMAIQGEPYRFDMSTRRSLARYLASDACADGSHVIAFGSGLKNVEPVVISGKSLRLELESTGETPLVLQPEPSRAGETPDEAWLTVRNGTLDLVNVRLRLPPGSRTKLIPNSAILLEDASLSLRNSTIEGPRREIDGNAALIRWIGGEGEGRGQDRAILLEDSFLVGLSPLLSGPVHWQSLVLRNSVLACGTDAIVIDSDSPVQRPAALILDHCTVAAGGAAIRVQTPAASTDSEALTLYARASVFAGPVDEAPQAPSAAVVAHSAGAAKNGSLIWWGSANGYSPRLTGFRVDGAGLPGDFESSWLSGWGEGHEANPLTGATDVLFASPIIDLKLIQPTSFELLAAATASTWGPTGEPIGASVEGVGPRQGGGDSSSMRPKSAGQPDARSRTRNPGF